MVDEKIKRRSILLGSAKISALIGGESNSETVLLLHGAGLDSAALSWKPTVERLSERYHVVAPDWPGYGKSPPADEPSTTALLVRLTGELVDTIGKPKVRLCGLSMGGGVALSYALKDQNRIEQLVLVGSHGLHRKAPQHLLRYLFSHIPGVGEWMFASARCKKRLSPSSLKGVFYDQTAISEQIMEKILKELDRPDAGRATLQWQRSELQLRRLRTFLLDRVDELKVPTLFISGENDALVPVDGARQASNRVAGSVLHIIPECGHWPQREKPAEFHDVFVQFLSSGQAPLAPGAVRISSRASHTI